MLLTALCVIVCSSASEQLHHNGLKKIDGLNILLPIFEGGKFYATHDLLAFNGCYSWKSSHPDLLEAQILKEDKNQLCSTKSRLTVKTMTPYSGLIWITAADYCNILHSSIQLEGENKISHFILFFPFDNNYTYLSNFFSYFMRWG